MPFDAFEGEHVGTLELTDTGYHVVACACGWHTARYLDESDAQRQHHSHVQAEANIYALQERIHGPHGT